MFRQASLGVKEALLGLTPVEPDGKQFLHAHGQCSLVLKPFSPNPKLILFIHKFHIPDEDVGGAEHGFEPRTDPAIHRAAFENDVHTLRDLLRDSHPGDLIARDPQGNNPLHVAVLAHSHGAAQVLLAAGVSPENTRSSRKWTPLDDAIALKDHKMIRMLLEQHRMEIKKERKARKPRLLAVMHELPDFFMALRWELRSPLFGLLLRRYAPDDTYLMWKMGLRLRIDGTLRGLDPTSHALLPKWKRGPFSLLVDASTTPVAATLVDHTEATYVDLYAERKAAVRDIDQDVRDLIEAGAGRVRLKGSELDFAAKTSILGRPVTEKVDGWSTQVFEYSGRLVAQVLQRAPVVLPPDCSFDEYLLLELPEDGCEEVPWDPLRGPPPSVANTFSGEDPEVGAEMRNAVQARDASAAAQVHHAHPISHGKGNDAAREVKGECWMARDFPMTLRQLLPLLDAVGGANKHIAAAAGFIAQYKDQSLFPIKIKVPLMWTVYLLLRFKRFRELKHGTGEPALDDPCFFEVPKGYKRVALMEQTAATVEDTFYDAEEAH